MQNYVPNNFQESKIEERIQERYLFRNFSNEGYMILLSFEVRFKASSTAMLFNQGFAGPGVPQNS